MSFCFANVTDIYQANLDNQCNKTWGKKANDPSAFLTYYIAGTVCLSLSTVVLLKYNSVTVMNVTVHSRTISNMSWVVYFTVSAVRSFVSGAFFMYEATSTYDDHKEPYFITDTLLMLLGVVCLAWVLNHQRLHRARGFLSQEISRFNYSQSSTHDRRLRIAQICRAYFLSVEAAVLCLFLAAAGVLVALVVTGSHVLLYWIYLGFFWLLCLIVVALSVVISKKSNPEGPKCSTKVLFLTGVLLSLPADIPASVWRSDCLRKHDFCTVSRDAVSSSDLTTVLFIISAVVFFVALRKEFLRLNQEAQWSAVKDAESLYGPSL